MPSDLIHWQTGLRDHLAHVARNPRQALADAGIDTLYGTLLGSTILPVAAAYATEPATALAALAGVAGGLGGNLLANVVQQRYTGADAAIVAARDAADPALVPQFEALAQHVGLFALAAAELRTAGQQDMLDQLTRELAARGKTHWLDSANINVTQRGGVNFGIGTTIGSIGTVTGGDTVDGDKIVGDKIIGPTIGTINAAGKVFVGTTQTITNTPDAAPDAMTVVALFAAPRGQPATFGEEELRVLRSTLTPFAARVRLVEHTHGTPADLFAALLHHRPALLHIHAHGSAAGLVLEDAHGDAHVVDWPALLTATNACASLRGVVLQACDSGVSAALGSARHALITAPAALSTETARAFAAGFYAAIAADLPPANAHAQGIARLALLGGDPRDWPQFTPGRGV